MVFLIQKMDCPTEEKLIRNRLEGMPGIDGLQFNLIQRELTVLHRLPSIDAIMETLKALDMGPAVKSDSLAAAIRIIGEECPSSMVHNALASALAIGC